MIIPVPPFPWSASPEMWDDLSLLAGTVFLEAEGEPWLGKLGVAWVIRSRADDTGPDIQSIVLAPAQFSCWLEGVRRRAEARLCSAEGPALEECWKAAASAYWRLGGDPTCGARFYLNVALTRKGRPDGSLPAWAEEKLAKGPGVVIGAHTFFV